jgi:hypothetical protein
VQLHLSTDGAINLEITQDQGTGRYAEDYVFHATGLGIDLQERAFLGGVGRISWIQDDACGTNVTPC